MGGGRGLKPAPERIVIAQAGIPIKGWEPDNNFVVDYRPIKNWIGVDWNKFEPKYVLTAVDFRTRIAAC